MSPIQHLLNPASSPPPLQVHQNDENDESKAVESYLDAVNARMNVDGGIKDDEGGSEGGSEFQTNRMNEDNDGTKDTNSNTYIKNSQKNEDGCTQDPKVTFDIQKTRMNEDNIAKDSERDFDIQKVRMNEDVPTTGIKEEEEPNLRLEQEFAGSFDDEKEVKKESGEFVPQSPADMSLEVEDIKDASAMSLTPQYSETPQDEKMNQNNDAMWLDAPPKKKRRLKNEKKKDSSDKIKRKKKRKVKDEVEDIVEWNDKIIDEGEKSNQVYCVCKVAYTDDRFMIACDGCDNWFHGQCVSISEDDTTLLDRWYCPDCYNDGSKEGEVRTTMWKDQCANDGCKKAARGSRFQLSLKYCSIECGIQNAERNLSMFDKEQRRYIKEILSSGRLTKLALLQLRGKNDLKLVEHNPADSIDAQDKETIERRRKEIASTMESIREMRGFLDAVVERASRWGKDEDTESPSKSGSEPCGMDQRLAWDPDKWTAYLNGEVIGLEEEGLTLKNQLDNGVTDGLVGNPAYMCLRSRRQCDRHSGWHKTNSYDLDIQEIIQNETLEQLRRDERGIRRRIKRRVYNLLDCANYTIDHSQHQLEEGP